jgi:predicted ArsR family transcriptional regulator
VVTDELADRLAGIAALAEPARRALYDYVAAQPEAVGRDEAAQGAGVPVHSARFHLDRLVQEGLLSVEFRRRSGRSGPGAGRPAKLYRRAEREIAVSLPERHYDLAGQILARSLERAARDGVDPVGATRTEALEEGRRIGRALPGEAPPGAGDERERAMAALAGGGYEPRLCGADVVLANCPFHALAREHTALVCGMNQALVKGVLEGLGCSGLEAVLDPQPDLCCVTARPRRAGQARREDRRPAGAS